MKKKERSGTIAIAVPAGLTALFVVLKVTRVIDWSWVWVTAPAWVPCAVIVVLIAVCFVLGLFYGGFGGGG